MSNPRYQYAIPPQPTSNLDFNSPEWQTWFRQIRQNLQTTGTVNWGSINFTGSSLSDIVTRPHNVLQQIQGGKPGEYYHLDSTQFYTVVNVTGRVSALETAVGIPYTNTNNLSVRVTAIENRVAAIEARLAAANIP